MALFFGALLLFRIRNAAFDFPELNLSRIAVNVPASQRNSVRFLLREKVITVANDKLMTPISRLEFSCRWPFLRDLLRKKLARIFGAELQARHFAGVFLSSDIIDHGAFC